MTPGKAAANAGLVDELKRARRETDTLFEMVRPEALYDRPIPERHRIVFYIGHLEAFDWNLLAGAFGLKPFDPEFDRLFAFGIDPVDGGLPADSPDDWPSLEYVLRYRDLVRRNLDAKLSGCADRLLLDVAIEHRLMHAETLAYMFHQLPYDRKVKPDAACISVERIGEGPRTNAEQVEIASGRVTLGLVRDSGEFGWDNEFDEHTLDIAPFAIDRYKVTNAQFARFIAEGGYKHREFWSHADWEWRSREGVEHPVFWVPDKSGGWMYRTMFEEIPLRGDWPVYVSHAEASAYCRSVGKRLPTEAQWQRAAEGGKWIPETRDRIWDPWPVGAVPSGESRFGVAGMTANGWEWTSTEFAPFEGFRPFPFYTGYSADFFDGKHYVLKGGSVCTAARLLRRSFRNWFQPHYRYVYAGFRCVT
jgi:iron(II)-dependent oxidoreductase